MDFFLLLLDRLNEAEIPYNEEIGGHSAVWAKRAQIEGCRSYIAAYPSEYAVQNLKQASTQSLYNFLLFPSQEIRDLGFDPSNTKEDIHLVLEYLGGEQILGYTAPRSNRMYFVNDHNGGSLK